MNIKYLRHELRLLYLSFTKYGRGFSYMYMRFVIGPRIAHHTSSLSRPPTNGDVSAHFLTGARDFTMALWALASFYRYSTFVPKMYFHTDGTLTEKHKKIIGRIFPDAVYVDGATVDSEYAEQIKAVPEFVQFKKMFPGFQSKKLIDTFVAAPFSYRFVLDSDILWFRDPIELKDAYLAKKSIMMDGAGGLCPQKFTDGTQTDDFLSNLNSGITGFAKESFSMTKFADYISKLDLSYTHHFVEQAAFAVCLNGVTSLPSEKYIIKGELKDSVIARHYTSPSRAKFFFYGLDKIWKDVLKKHVRN